MADAVLNITVNI